MRRNWTQAPGTKSRGRIPTVRRPRIVARLSSTDANHLRRSQTFVETSLVRFQSLSVNSGRQIFVLELPAVEVVRFRARDRREIERTVSISPPLVQYALVLSGSHASSRTAAYPNRPLVSHRRRVGRPDRYDCDFLAPIKTFLDQQGRRGHDISVAPHIGQRAKHLVRDGQADGRAIVCQAHDGYSRAPGTRKVISERADRLTNPLRRVSRQGFLELDPRAFVRIDQARQLLVVDPQRSSVHSRILLGVGDPRRDTGVAHIIRGRGLPARP